MKPKIIEFLRSKDFKFIRNIGQGGTGETILIKDEIIDEQFVCKKYSPIYEEDKSKYFNYFIDEIKILFKLNHRNIVRVFNYYLYPDQLTGYILMEYIEGLNIVEFIRKNPDRLNDLFPQVIEGFCNLEQNNILHRDIRPENILVNDLGVVKIIDFGFGKRLENSRDTEKSVTLNWRYSVPKEFESKIYDFKSEIYFVGKLFEEILVERGIDNFKYSSILSEMIKPEYDQRISSFFDVSRKILGNTSEGIEFSEKEITVYRNFANKLTSLVARFDPNTEYITDIDTVIMQLEQVFRNSMLEEHIQNSNALIKCLIRGPFSFYPDNRVPVQSVNDFFKLLKSVSDDKRKIIVNNLWNRLDSISREDFSDDLPF
jgi:eukaryotic-like serine/threonine-protein kinase